MNNTNKILVLGSAPNALEIHKNDLSVYDEIIVINNAWRVLTNWTELIYPYDFPDERKPPELGKGQRFVTELDFVDVQNHFGGFVYAGATMAFTALYWALGKHRPRHIDILGCDMVYDDQSKTHFYGNGAADPLRADVTLRNLDAKSARFLCLSWMNKCVVKNLSNAQSRLVFPRSSETIHSVDMDNRSIQSRINAILKREQDLGYFFESGRYWESEITFDVDQLDDLDADWLACADDILALMLAN